MAKWDFLIVGAGFAGSVSAERLASAGYRCLVIDKRPHIGGNAFDALDDAGIRVHPYGPHIFHTNSAKVFEYLSQFTQWRFYEHRVLAWVEGSLYPIPINRTTVNRLYGLDLDEAGVEAFFESVRVPRSPIVSSEDVVLNSVGPDLCDKFFRFYTKKQWGLDLSELSAGVAARIPTRTNTDDRYFADKYQFMPDPGYAEMFQQMLSHPNIEVRTGVEFESVKGSEEYGHLLFTGPVDEFFGYRFGRLPYRSLQFVHEHIPDQDQVQAVGTINYPMSEDFTRITEFKHLTGQTAAGTSVVREYPSGEGDPFYPIPRPENEALYRQYRDIAAAEENVTFVGRLAEYRYFNMDQVVGAALATAEKLIERRAALQP